MMAFLLKPILQYHLLKGAKLMIKNRLLVILAGVMCITALCSCQSNAKSGINEETMFARDFIKVQYDKFSVGLGAPGDVSNRYTVDDLASVTQLDT